MPAESRVISVVIAARNCRADAVACLASLSSEVDAHCELVVACTSDDSLCEVVARDFGWARLVRCAPGSGLGAIRARGLAGTTGSVVVFLDPYCRVPPGWLARWRDQPWDQFAAVGGLVEPVPRAHLAEWAAFLSEYAPHLAPMPAGEATTLTGNNVAFKRAALEQAGLIDTPEFWKTFAVWALRAGGERCWTDPRQIVRHVRATRLGEFTRDRYWHGRSFGATRTSGRGWALRLARAASCPAVPFVLTARLVRDVHSRRNMRRLLWQSLPFAVLFNVAWAVGELDGYLRGSGPASSRLA